MTTEKKGIASKSVARHQASHRRISIWWTKEEYAQLVGRAEICSTNLSEYVRSCSLGLKIEAKTDREATQNKINHLMKLGGLQKKLITDLRAVTAESNCDVSKIIAATDILYQEISVAIHILYQDISAAIHNLRGDRGQ